VSDSVSRECVSFDLTELLFDCLLCLVLCDPYLLFYRLWSFYDTRLFRWRIFIGLSWRFDNARRRQQFSRSDLYILFWS